MSHDAPHNPYSLGDQATTVGRVRPFPASMMVHLVRSLISKMTGPLTVLVVAESKAQAALLRHMQSRFTVHNPKQGGAIAESVGMPYPCQVVIVDSPDHPLLVGAASRPGPANTGTVIVATQPLSSACALAQIEQQRAAVRYQLDPAL